MPFLYITKTKPRLWLLAGIFLTALCHGFYSVGQGESIMLNVKMGILAALITAGIVEIGLGLWDEIDEKTDDGSMSRIAVLMTAVIFGLASLKIFNGSSHLLYSIVASSTYVFLRIAEPVLKRCNWSS